MKIDPQLKSILEKHFEDELNEANKKVTIISAYKLSQDELDAIAVKFPFTKEKIVVNVVDPEIIGGFIITHESKLIDLSIKSLLQSVQQTLYNHTI